MTTNKPTDADLLGCAGVSSLHGNTPAIFGTADIRRFAECVLKNWGQTAMPADAEDAARYRWLRSRDVGTIKNGGVFAGLTPDNVVLNGTDLDEAIDAAMEMHHD